MGYSQCTVLRFYNAGYFARVFKQEFGVTPQEWRVMAKQV